MVATATGLEVAARYGLPADAYRMRDRQMLASLQWTPSPGFARWLRPRLGGADLVHAHMVGAWRAAARALPPDVPLVASEHNEMCWPGRGHTPQAGPRPGASTCSSRMGRPAAHGPLVGLDDGRLREGRSALDGLSAEPLPGLPSPRLAFTGRFRAGRAPEVLVAVLALLVAPPPAYLVGDGPTRQAVIRLVSACGLDRLVRLPGWSHE